MLAAIAAATQRIRLGPLVTPLPSRRPWKVARESVTLDHLSVCRLVLGVGLGIDYWREFVGFGEEGVDDRAWADLLDDGIEIIERLWTGERGVVSRPAPRGRRRSVPTHARQAPRIPIWSATLAAAAGPAAARRAMGRCRAVPAGPTDDARECPRAVGGRSGPALADQGAFEMCLHGRQELAADFAEAGVTWFMESCYPEQSVGEVRRIIADGPPRV